MRLRALPIVMVGLFVLALAGGALAEEKPLSFGVQANWSDDTDLGVGVRARLDLADLKEGLGAVASFDYFFPGDQGFEGVDFTYWEINANLTYDLPLDSSAVPYIGGGPVLAHASGGVEVVGVEISDSTNEVGFNILGGVKKDLGESMKLFAEAKYEIKGGEQFVLSVGVRF